jgi:hypothetical protein
MTMILRRFAIAALIACAGLTSTVAAAVAPALPQTFISTLYQLPTGTRHRVSTGAELRSALAAAQRGDVIEMRAGATFVGPFTLPAKSGGSGWIYIVTSDYDRLPRPCERVRPADAAFMPKIVAAAGGSCVTTAAGSHHYRFVGIEFAPTPGNFLYNVVLIGNGETGIETLPHDVVIDRCYIHGDPIAGSRRGVLMNGASVAVVESYIADCKEDGADSQALACYSTTGPLKIVNNYLEGAGENVIFGGADPSIPNAVPSDIEIRCNHFFKPLSWMSEEWDIKNLLEFKNAQRALVEGNLFENNWPNAQNGFAVLLTPRNQNNGAPWSVVQDITIRFNRFVNIAQGINISGFDAPNVSQRTSRILVRDNEWHLENIGAGGDGRLFQVLNGPTDVVFDHNTGFTRVAYVVSDGSPKTDFFVFQNNIVNHGVYGFIGSGTGTANTTLARYFNPNWTVTSNVDIGGSATGYPAGNYFPSDMAAVGFVDVAGGNYRLSASSPYAGRGTDGRDIGANLDSIAIASTYLCDGPVSIPDASTPNELTILPNPAGQYVRVTTAVTILDLLGREVCSGDGFIDVSALPNGIYIVRSSTAARSLVVQH